MCSGDESGDVFILSENKSLLQNFMLLLTAYQLVIIFIGAIVQLTKQIFNFGFLF